MFIPSFPFLDIFRFLKFKAKTMFNSNFDKVLQTIHFRLWLSKFHQSPLKRVFCLIDNLLYWFIL